MEFTFKEYKNILDTLKKYDYKFWGYDNWSENNKSVILRHDVDASLEKALEMAEFEKDQGVTATYFVLITSDLYNAFSKKNIEIIKKIKSLGMEIGLHFDEAIYPINFDIISAIRSEIKVMQQMLDIKIKSVSMHRPSKKTLEANYDLGNLVDGENQSIANSYSNQFFGKFKYVSDSKRNWRENIYEIIETGNYPKIHLLTHPVWYHDENLYMWDTISKEVCFYAKEAYDSLEVFTKGVEGKKTLSECLEGIQDDSCR